MRDEHTRWSAAQLKDHTFVKMPIHRLLGEGKNEKKLESNKNKGIILYLSFQEYIILLRVFLFSVGLLYALEFFIVILDFRFYVFMSSVLT